MFFCSGLCAPESIFAASGLCKPSCFFSTCKFRTCFTCCLSFSAWIISRPSQDRCACCGLVNSSGESAVHQIIETSHTHHAAGREWLRPTCALGTWPAGSVDASWLLFFRLCSVCWGFLSESIISQDLLETVSAFSSVRLRHFLPAVQLCSPAAGTRSCWAAGQWMGQLAASLLWGLCASVRLPASEISCLSEVWELKSLCWDCRFQFWNPRRSTPGPMLQERVWSPIPQCMQLLQASYGAGPRGSV